MNPKISIILPVWKDSRYIDVAINSVIAQTFFDWELIIIDDGLYNGREDEIKEYINKDKRIIFLKNEKNFGIQKTLNIGLKKTKGEYVARIDDDDEWIDKNKLKNQVDFLDNNRDYVLVGTGVITTDENRKELFRYLLPKKDKDIRSKILGKNCFIHSSVIFRKDAVLKVGGYGEEEKIKHVEDYDLWLKLGLIGKFANLDTYAVSFMARSGTLTSDNRLTQATRSMSLSSKYRSKYNNFLFNYCLNLGKLVFFFLQKTFLFKDKTIYKIQSLYKKY